MQKKDITTYAGHGATITTTTPVRLRPEIRWPRPDLSRAELRRIVLEAIG